MKPARTTSLRNDIGGYQYIQEINAQVLDGNISFGSTTSNSSPDQNIECWKATGTTPNPANTAFSIAHGLGRVPITFIGDLDQPGIIYRSGTAWTATTAYFKCNSAGANYVIVLL